MSGESDFHVRLGRIYSPSGTGKFVSFAGRVRRAAQKSSRSSGGRVKSSAVAEKFFTRRAIVKTSLVKMGAYGKDAQRHHLDYIQRESAAREGDKHGMREAAEHLATLELGPITQIDVAKRLAGEIHKERFTKLDRDLLDKSVNQIVDVSAKLSEGMNWQTRFEKGRVKALAKLGLAEKVGFGKWRLDDNLERTLRRLGDRGDIIKAYHHALKQSGLERATYSDPVYDPVGRLAKPVTGRVVKTGVLDDVSDRTYMVVDTVHGEAIFLETGRAENIGDITPGMIVKAGPQAYSPKQSDYTIADIASKHEGIYSPSAHEMSDPSAREEYIKAHVRRLEAMRRKGHAQRNSDGSWQIPHDYLKRASAYEKARGFGNPVKLDVLARSPLQDLPQTIGKTWLDEELRTGRHTGTYEGFGEDVETAKIQRRQFLMRRGLIADKQPITEGTLKALETLDLDAAAKRLSSTLGKAYCQAPEQGRVSGVYREAIVRPRGKYAVIEKSKEFTLVPWRETMDRNLGKSISGVMKGQTISWTLSKARGQSIS